MIAEREGSPPVQAVTLVVHYIDKTAEDWHFETTREAKDFLLAIQAAKAGHGDDWMCDIFQVDVRPFSHSVN